MPSSENVILQLKTLFLVLFFCVCGCSSGSSPMAQDPLVDDPLFSYQWHIRNTGQAAFSQGGGVTGEDLRMTKAIADGVSGQGIIIAVLDDSLEIAHEDLKSNVVPNGSYNYVDKTTDPTSTMTKGEHGTSVAGIAAAVSMNGKGGRGVAPRASLKGFNVLAVQNEQAYIESMGGHPRSEDVHVFNMSYGDVGTAFDALSTSARELYNATATLRGGKGGIYVKSAGNGFSVMKISGSNYFCSSESYGRTDLTCQNATAEEENARPEVITVGAFNARGLRSSYSTAGSVLWISAPGGEYGTDSPAIITTDQTSCEKGYSRSRNLYIPPDGPANDFETGEPENDGQYNPGCNYTSGFNGTSSAAPNASGAIALMLQTNQNLTRRDVKYILAKTARRIDSQSSASIVNVSIDGVNYQASQGWVKNAADYYFHNWYGFGALNVDAAVAMAKDYQTLPALQDKSYGGALAAAVDIPDNRAAGVTQTITVPMIDNLTIENLFVRIAIDHPNTAEIGIEITSPSGTRNILLNISSAVKTGLNVTGGVILGSNAFYGEKSIGTWTLKVLDSVPEKKGKLKHFGLQILGY